MANQTEPSFKTYRSLYSRVADHRLSAVTSRLLTNSSVEHCATTCAQEPTFQCKSFDFDNRGKQCMLFRVGTDDPDVHLISSAGRDHYHTAYARLFSRLPHQMLTTSHNRRLEDVSVEECSRRCVLEAQFKCRGMDYELATSACYLTELSTLATGAMHRVEGWDFYERFPEGPLSRFVNYGTGRLRQLERHEVYQKRMLGVSLENCATYCLAETTFHCVSFDYQFDGDKSTCFMSTYLAANVYGLADNQHTLTLHYELKGRYLNYFYPTPYAVVLGNNHKTYSRVTPDRCARMCMEEESFICRSFDYTVNDPTCYLSSKTGSDVGGLFTQGLKEVHHFEMKPLLDCGGNLTEAEGNFASPNWPRNYAHHEYCAWNIVLSKHKVIHFHFTHFDLGLQSSDPCSAREDRVVITERLPVGTRTFCVLPNTRKFVTRSNQVKVEFFANGEVDGPGFRAFYTAEWTCDVHLSSAPGEIASPEYPDNYPSSTRCSWRITAPEGQRVRLVVTSFELEQHLLGHCNENFDHVMILDGGTISAPKIGLYCGVLGEPLTLKSTGRDLFVQFKSDASSVRKGFHAEFEFEAKNGTVYSTEEQTDQIVPLDKNEHGALIIEDNDVHPQTGKQTGEGELQAEGGDGAHTGASVGNQHPASHQYRSTMWAIVCTLMLLLIVVFIVLVLVWRHYRRRLRGHHEEIRSDDDIAAEQVPLQEGACAKPNNEVDLSLPSTSTASPQFSNLLYSDQQKDCNLSPKNINQDTKGTC